MSHVRSVALACGFFAIPLAAQETAIDHWSFRPVVAPAIPTSENALGPIDAFLGSRDEKPEDRYVLARRLSFDLIGLPPTPEELAAFVADTNPDAVERYADRLLASPHFGERWAQHWLDVVRYGESNGYELDATRPNAWRYRDYVIDSFNADKPYDVFVTEQVAGDRLARGRDPVEVPDLWVATGMHLAGPRHVVGGNIDKEQLRYELLTEMVTGVSSAFLGLTVHCARCHDHKFDPISQRDYFRLQAYFATTVGREIDIATGAEKAAHEQRTAEVNARLKPIRDAIVAIDAPIRERIKRAKIDALEAPYREALNTPTAERTEEQKILARDAQTLIKVSWDEILDELTPEQAVERAGLRERQHAVEIDLPIQKQAMAVADEGDPARTHVLIRGEVRQKGERVGPGVPAVFGRPEAEDTADRSDLAAWLTERDNPLAARVVVNRLWQHHTGRGIVATPNDFGRRGAKPTSPELLDHLADELADGGWTLKRIHRAIVTSAAYRASPRKRLQGEALRDTAMVTAGTLNRQMFGPMIRVPIEPEVYDLIFTEGEPDGLWPVTPDANQHSRRSVYLFAKRNVRLPIFEAFDQPDRLSPCGERTVSTFAPQALILMNGPFMREQAAAFAARLRSEAGVDRGRVVGRAYLLAFARPPSREEARIASDFLTAQAESHREAGAADPEMAALTDLSLALLNTNEFAYVR